MFWRQREAQIVDRTAGKLNSEALDSARRQYEERLRAIAPDRRFVVDTNPTQIMNLGLLHIAFPQARIIHIARDPAATIRSIYATPVRNAPDFACDMQNIVFAHEQFQRLMDHWRKTLPASAILEVRFEELTQSTEAELRKILAFLGVEWDAACLHGTPAKAPRAADFWHFRHRDHLGA